MTPEQIEGLKQDFAVCREQGHDYSVATGTVHTNRTVRWDDACMRCCTKRTRIKNRHGDVISANYHYPVEQSADNAS